MKLIYCDKCHDVVRLIPDKWRTCFCGQSGGQYNEDLVTATVGGEHCRVFGIPNPFFDEVFQYLTDRGKQWYRDRKGPYGITDAWWGETPGDLQIFRIKSPNGPRIKIKISNWTKNENRISIVDKRYYTIDGEKLDAVIIEKSPSSFRGKK